jgi:3-oxoacyl-[acyl-carrier protein] reductase
LTELRTALVTGAARGLGAAIAAALLERGYRVLLTDVDAEANEATVGRLDPAGDRAAGMAVDVRSLSSIEAAVAECAGRWGRLDVMVNNAARTAFGSFWEIDPDDWDDVLAVNLRGVFFGCRAAGAHMRSRPGGGRIVNLASIAGQHGRGITAAHYASSKAAIVGLTRVVAMELAPDRITVNAVAPAAIEGPQTSSLPPERLDAMRAAIPLGRLGRPAEVAALVVFLASERAGFVTGATFDVNGGLLMR